MVELIPGLGEPAGALSGVSTGLSNFMNVFLIVFGVLLVAGFLFGIIYFYKKKVLDYNIPITLKFEVGDSVMRKEDWGQIVNLRGERTFKFRKFWRIIAEVPADDFAYIHKSRKGFEAFVRNDQATWVLPKPYVRTIPQEIITKDEAGNETKTVIQIPTFVTAPANLLRYSSDRLRRNAELSMKLKWWQNPAVLALGAMGIFVVSVVFIYIMHQSVITEVGRVIDLGQQSLAQCGGQVLK